MVRTAAAIAALPVINALYIPHDLHHVAGDLAPAQADASHEFQVADVHYRDPANELAKGEFKAPREVLHRVHGKAVKDDDSDNSDSGSDSDSEVVESAATKKPCKKKMLKKMKHMVKHQTKNGMGNHGHKYRSKEFKDPMATVTVTGEVIPNRYIIVLKDDVSPESFKVHMETATQATANALSVYLAAGTEIPVPHEELGIDKVFDLDNFKGYAGTFLDGVLDQISSLFKDDILIIEPDTRVHTLETETESGAPWGLARVSHRQGLSLGTFNKYLYDDEGGEDVTAYIVDTGVYVDHDDFEGRAVWGKTIPVGDVDIDAHGHGSHCAGTIGGKKYGVAKKAKLVAVKVLGSDGSGSMSDVIGGVEYVVQSHRQELKKNPKLKGSTANMSLGGGKSPSLDLAVNAAVNAGVHFAVAAGNENQDACNVSPSGATGPVTVGATTLNDERAYFSNYGKCVDIFAPGVNVQSVGTSSPSSSAVMSGTSMASPHICGLLTYFLSLQPSTDSEYATRGAITPKELKKDLIAFGTPDVITELDSESPNVLAYNGGGKDIGDLWSASASKSTDAETITASETLEKLEDSLLDEFHSIVNGAAEYLGDLNEKVEDLTGFDLF